MGYGIGLRSMWKSWKLGPNPWIWSKSKNLGVCVLEIGEMGAQSWIFSKLYYDKPTWTVHKFQNLFLAIPWFWCRSIAKMWFFNLSLQIFDFLTFWPVMGVWVEKKFFDIFDFFHFSTLRTKIFKNFFDPIYSPGARLLPGNTFGRVRCVSG